MELFLRGRKLHILLVFILQSYFKIPKTIRLNSTHYFVMKIPNKREFQQIESSLTNVVFKGFMKRYKDGTKEPFPLLVNDRTLSSDNPLRFMKNLLWNKYYWENQSNQW